MAKRIIGLIGNGQGPIIHVEGNCVAIVEGLTEDGVVTLCIDGKDPIVIETDSIRKLDGKPKRLFFAAERASRSLVCRIQMEA